MPFRSMARSRRLVVGALLAALAACGDSRSDVDPQNPSGEGGAAQSDAPLDQSISPDAPGEPPDASAPDTRTPDARAADAVAEPRSPISEEEWARISGPQDVAHDVVTHASYGCPWQKISQEFRVQPTVGCRVRQGTAPNTIRDCDIEPYCTTHDDCGEKSFGICRGSASNRCVYPVDLPLCSTNADCASINGTCSPLAGTDTYCYPTGRCEKRERRCSYRTEACDSDAECATFAGGVCQKRVGSLRCEYLQCMADTDCALGARCACTETSSGNMCVPADCQIDTDCGDGRTCRLEIGCHGRAAAYHCSTAADTCTSNEDCRTNGSGFCAFSGGVWMCRNVICPPVGP
jgi:hypothetical protein